MADEMPRWSQGDKCRSPYSGDNRLYRGFIKGILQSPTGTMALVKFDGYHESESEEVSLDKLVRVNDQNVKGNSNSGGYVEGRASQDSHFKKPLIPETTMNVTHAGVYGANQGNMVQNQSNQGYVDNNNGNQNGVAGNQCGNQASHGNSREEKRARSDSRERSTDNREGTSTEGSNERNRSKDRSSGNSGERRHSQGRDRSGSKERRDYQSQNQWQGTQSMQHHGNITSPQIGQGQNRSYASPNSGYNSSFNAQYQGGRGCQGGYNSSNYGSYGQTPDSRFRRDDDSDVFLSKTLSSILRHNAKNFGLELMKGGFLYVDEILRQVHKLKYYTDEDFKRIVDSNDKKRFSMEIEGGRLKIRANQGHSIQVQCLELTPITSADDVPIVVHGTYEEAWELIKETGLHRMNRNHIHFAAGEPGKSGVISGMRSTCQVMIYIDMEKALKDGLKFCRSANNVILCDGDKDGIIYPCYFRGVLHRFGRYKMPYDTTICSASIKSKTAAAETDGNKKRKKKSKKDSQEKSAEIWDEETLDANTKEHNDGASTDESSLPAAKKQHLQQSTDDAKPAADNSSVNDIISASRKEDNVVGKYEDWVVEPTYITDLDQSKCCVDYLIKNPSHIAVCCIGKNLGEAESQINVIVISVHPYTYVYNLHDNKTLVADGELCQLLMHKDIHKVFCDIGLASASLINEYDLLLDGIPIWDIGMTYSKVTLPAMQLEALGAKYGFTKSTVKQWASQNEEFGKKLMSNELDETVVNKLMERGKLIWELFAYCQKQFNEALIKALKKEVYSAAIPSSDTFLAEKIAKLKLERKEKSKKKQENVEGVTQQQSQQQQQQQQHKKGKGASQQQKKGKSGKGKK